MKRVALSILVLCLCAGAQVISVGPLGQPPIDASQCKVLVDGQTSLCFAKDGVHVSLGGLPFGPAIATLKGDKGDKGDPGVGTTGPKGDPGISIKGDKGDKGDQGIQGDKGIQGDTGPHGDTGPQGVPGTFPTSFTLTCATGFGNATHSSKCTISVP